MLSWFCRKFESKHVWYSQYSLIVSPREKMEIKIVNNADKQAWDNYVLNHPQGIAYQLFAWKEAVEKAYGFEGTYLIAQNENQIYGIFPLIQVNLPLLNGNLVSLPYCDAGGPLADSPDIEQELILKALSVSQDAGINNLTIRSIDKFADIDPDLTINKEKVRMLLELPESSDELLASLKAKVRSQVKKPIRDGLTTQIGGVELLDEFYTLFSENMRDLGSPVHSKKWFQAILESFGENSRLFVVKMPDQTPAAGGILLCHPNTISVPWASSLRRFNRSNPNMLLYWGFLQYASDNGFKYFDFGRSTPNEGTYRFKKQWGAKPKPLHWSDFKVNIIKNSALSPQQKAGHQGHGTLKKLAESIIIKMPIPVSQTFGALTRKYITL